MSSQMTKMKTLCLFICLLSIQLSIGCSDPKTEEDTQYTSGTAVKDYTRDSVWIVTETDSIFGILFMPVIQDGKKIPAVLCLQGGGYVGLLNYYYEPSYFAKNGFAALLCDKAGSGLSSGENYWERQSFEQKTDEYAQLLRWLKRTHALTLIKLEFTE